MRDRMCVETVRLGMSCAMHSSTARLSCQKKCDVLSWGPLLTRAGSIACTCGRCHTDTGHCAPLWDGPSSLRPESAASDVRVAARRAAAPPFDWYTDGSAG